jgi:hypothetical protein
MPMCARLSRLPHVGLGRIGRKSVDLSATVVGADVPPREDVGLDAEQVGPGAQEQELEVGLLVDPPGGSTAATQTMRDLGFTHVVDGGGQSELVEAGAPVSP